jgi:amidophosphoribosyltransferase
MAAEHAIEERPVSTPFDHPREECGVFGVYAPDEDVARLTYFGLFALQHRGQESAGMAVADGSEIVVYRDLGLVSQVFNERVMDGLSGHIAMGHVRYSTTGSSGRWDNAQPLYKTRADGGGVALGHNGNLVNTFALARELREAGVELSTSSDTELIAISLAREDCDLVEAFRRVVPRLSGAYTLVAVDERALYGIRDPQGVRPLVIGRLPSGGWVFASETCALDIVGADYIREVEPGELVVADEHGLHSHPMAEAQPRLCVFEFVYFARPDSVLYGRNVYDVRRAMGKQLADESPAEADLVIAVPETATAAGQGYADRAGLPYAEGFVKNRYVYRTFIQPTQSQRAAGVRLKLNPLPDVIEGKRLIVVDDSIVRGTTTREMVEMLRKAGAREVHLRVASPPIRWPCFYGIDTANRDELIAAERQVSEIREFIGADSLGYLSVDGMLTSTGVPTERFCHACFSGGYPIPIPTETALTKNVLEHVEHVE